MSGTMYLILYMPTFAVNSLKVPANSAYLGGVVAGAVLLVGARSSACWPTGRARSG